MYEVINECKYYFEVKGSKFYSFIYNIKNKDEVDSILNNLKEEYPKATHYVYAYKIGDIERKTDDGEPSGTSGSPILNIINKHNLDNTLIVVIRYFGGVKLGAGGLIRAYSKASNNLISKDNLRKIEKKEIIKIKTNYKDVNKILRELDDSEIIDKEFDSDIFLTLNITEDKKKKLEELKLI